MSVITVIALACLVLFPIACAVAVWWFFRLMNEEQRSPKPREPGPDDPSP